MDHYVCKHTQTVHTLKCPLTVMAEGCWQQVCSWDTILTELPDALTTHTHTHAHGRTHTNTHKQTGGKTVENK